MTTYYQVLEVPSDASLLDIKKAYRRLALQHHPDRNHGSAASTERFKSISEAYEVLSDPEQRKEYDRSLRLGASTTTARPSYSAPPRYRNPYDQFDDLFRNDPFFSEAFRDLDDAFVQKFQSKAPRSQKHPQGWLPWILNMCGIDLEMSTTYRSNDGTFTATQYSSKAGKTYTDRKTRTYRDERGRQVTVHSMEKDGDRIEDKYIDDVRVERSINGVRLPIESVMSEDSGIQ
ncbi:DnaJ homolog subfamily B member 9 [Fistulifera solaris]|jgi:curved DNA-binding protein CbpA|uniref:DnaJ homolog subfamily B member 9 n=1 Tax=Fistulifera solaris TaxID=1519565 RepID=A0A1Z5K7C6_FISSO|nr:DnaJ homolog subfamily B member 9 [Fistulifera solaris]|eukprot:GAX22062.1 DnaJ homolog subfamily B member 9 [Fistulifera solaris]